MEFKFKSEIKDVNERKQISEKLIKLYPDKIPIICEKDPVSKIKGIEKTKYLINKNFIVSQFSLLLRNKIELNPEEAFFLLANGKYSILGEARLSDIYEKYADKDDGFLYIVYAEKIFMAGSLRKYL